jgi:hypothetical protein
MKTRLFEKSSLGLALSLLPFVTGSFGQASDAPQGFVFATNADTAAPPVANTSFVVAGESPFPMAAPAANLSAVPEPTPPTGKPLPPTIRPSSPTAEVVKLTQSGVDESVMLAFIANSTSTFNLGSDEIIYLNDLGVPDGVVTAMIQRDQALNGNWSSAAQASASAAANAQAAPAYETPPPAEPPPVESYAEPAPPADMSYFYNTLSPYGSWVSVDGYGWCWQPTVVVINPNWQPYCDRGHWIYTDCGWYWLSDYSWGWAPFHYGRWFRHERLGWCWTPDTVWAPAWVSWRYSNEYCGWAPLPPAAYFRPGSGLAFNGGSVGVNFDFGLSVDFYSFVPWTHFRDNRPYRYVVARRQAAQVFNNTVVINDIVQGRNNVVINHGIPPQRVASFTRTEVRPVAIQEAIGGTGRGGRSEQLGRDGRTLIVQRPNFAAAPKGGVRGNGGRASFSGSTAGPAQAGAQMSSPRGGGADRASQATTTTTTTPPSPSPKATPSSSVTVIGRSNAGQPRGGQNSSSAYNTPRGPAAQAQQRGSTAVTETPSSAARNNLPQQDFPRITRGIADQYQAPQSAPAPAPRQIAPPATTYSPPPAAPQYNSAPPVRSAPPPAASPRQSVESRPAPVPAPAPAPQAESPQSSGSGSSRQGQDQNNRSR